MPWILTKFTWLFSIMLSHQHNRGAFRMSKATEPSVELLQMEWRDRVGLNLVRSSMCEMAPRDACILKLTQFCYGSWRITLALEIGNTLARGIIQRSDWFRHEGENESCYTGVIKQSPGLTKQYLISRFIMQIKRQRRIELLKSIWAIAV